MVFENLMSETEYLKLLRERVSEPYQKIIDELFNSEDVDALKKFSEKYNLNVYFEDIFLIDIEKVAFELAEYILRKIATPETT
jgi:hypothetical protein